MDPFAGMLDGPRARGAFALRTLMSPPWSLRIVAESPLTLLAVVTGHAWVIPDQGEPVRLDVGDVAVTRAPDHYSVADDPASPTDVMIHPGQRCCSPAGESMTERMTLGVRTWGNDPQGSTLMLVGAYESVGDLSTRLLRALPPLLWLGNDQWESPLVALLCEEMAKDLPGQAAVLDRLLDLLLIAVLRTWFTRPNARTSRATVRRSPIRRSSSPPTRSSRVSYSTVSSVICNYNLDRLAAYRVEAISEPLRVVNPDYRQLDGQVRSATGKLTRRQGELPQHDAR